MQRLPKISPILLIFFFMLPHFANTAEVSEQATKSSKEVPRDEWGRIQVRFNAILDIWEKQAERQEKLIDRYELLQVRSEKLAQAYENQMHQSQEQLEARKKLAEQYRQQLNQ